jgi:hypothetical protein
MCTVIYLQTSNTTHTHTQYGNTYDTDVTTFDPKGKLSQIDYAIKGIEHGSVAVALRSKQFAVIGALKRQASELASYQVRTTADFLLPTASCSVL